MATDKLGDYAITKTLGSGAFGTVYKGNKADKVYAIKKIKLHDDEDDMTREKLLKCLGVTKGALQEILILKKTEHNNIIRYEESFSENLTFYIVMEFADKGTLSTNLEHVTSSERAVWIFFSHMASALSYLHSNGIIHRDLKPDNILCVTDRNTGLLQFKIADFGIAKLVGNRIQNRHYASTCCGTFCYMAPEVLKAALNPGTKYTASADIWSFGAVISFVCNEGVHLFKSPVDTLKWSGEKSSLPKDKKYTITLRQKVADLMYPDYHMRPTAASIEMFIVANKKITIELIESPCIIF